MWAEWGIIFRNKSEDGDEMTIEKLCEDNIRDAKMRTELGMMHWCKILGCTEEQTEHAIKTICPLIDKVATQATERLNEHTKGVTDDPK